MKYQVVLGWIIKLFGGDVIKRILHVPEANVEAAAMLAGVTKEQWRRVEGIQQMIVEEGIKV